MEGGDADDEVVILDHHVAPGTQQQRQVLLRQVSRLEKELQESQDARLAERLVA